MGGTLMEERNFRHEPISLAVLDCLRSRMKLSKEDNQYYQNLRHGYRGECQFDQKVSEVDLSCVVINDLLLENSHSEIQIDSIFIKQGKIYIIEIKNYEGDYYIKNDRWYSLKSKNEIKNPLVQLSRTEAVLRQILQNAKINIDIEAKLVFINPHFMLYHASPTHPIIFYPQLDQFFEKLSYFHASSREVKIAKYLESIQLYRSRNVYLPQYSFEELKKCLPCPKCHAPFILIGSVRLKCDSCGHVEHIENAISRAINDFHLLFPQKKITTQNILSFSGGTLSKRTCRRILKKQLNLIHCGRNSYFEIK